MSGERKDKSFYVIGFTVLMCFDTLTQISIKYASVVALPMEFNFPWFARIMGSVWIYTALAGYVGSFITWMTLLRHAPVGPSFAASHLEIISVTLLSIWLFNEPMTLYKGIGGILILLGILCLAQNASSDEPAGDILAEAVCHE